MKTLIIFIAIMMLFGSLKKPDIVPCNKEIYVRYYLDGKVIHVDKAFGRETTNNNHTVLVCENHNNIAFTYDKVVYSLK